MGLSPAAILFDITGTNSPAILNAAPVGTEYGLAVRLIGGGGGGGGTSSNFAAAFPTTGTAVGWSDGTNMQGPRVFDVDSGGGTQYVAGVNLRLSSSGGSIEAIGQKTMALSIPIAIASDQTSLPVTAASLPLPTGAATEATLVKLPLGQGSTTSGQSGVLFQGAVTTAAPTYVTAQTSPISLTTTGLLRVDGSGVTQPVSNANLDVALSTRLAEATFTGRINTFGQKTMANSTPIVIASDQTVIPVSQSGTWNITNISGTVSLPTGAATEATLAKLTIAQGATLGANTQALMGGSVTTAAPTYTTGQISPLSLTIGGLLRVDGSGTTQPVSNAGLTNLDVALSTRLADSTFTGRINTLGQKTMANSTPVTIASDQAAIPTSVSESVSAISLSSLNATQAVNAGGSGTVTIQLTSLGADGAVIFEASVDNATWISVTAVNITTSTISSSASTTGIWQIDCSGFLGVRVRVSNLTTGTITGTMRATLANAVVTLEDGNLMAINSTLTAVKTQIGSEVGLRTDSPNIQALLVLILEQLMILNQRETTTIYPAR